MKQRLQGLRDWLASYADPTVAAMLFLGFASGLPFPLVITTLSLRLREAGIDRTTIGLFVLVGLSYSLKFFWSPVVDRLRIPGLARLGRRRSWMLLMQCGVVVGLLAMAVSDPAHHVEDMVWLATFTAFCSATQDIVMDAWRIEMTKPDDQGTVLSAYQTGYQIALICGGAGALGAAEFHGWTFAYFVMAACMLIGPITTLFVREPAAGIRAVVATDAALLDTTIARLRPGPLLLSILITGVIGLLLGLGLFVAKQSITLIAVTSGAVLFIEVMLLATLKVHAFRPVLERLTAGVVLPLAEFFARNGVRAGALVLVLILLYRLNYSTMGAAANTFYFDLGYTKDDIAIVSKIYGILMTLAGTFVAAAQIRRFGILKTMLVGLVLLSVANLYYAWIGDQLGSFLSAHAANPKTAPHPSIRFLTIAVSIDNLANGIAGTAFIAYMSSLTSRAYTATQYALFGTLWSLPAKSLASQWGRIVDAFGYPPFFIYTSAIGIPSLLLVLWLMRHPVRPTRASA